MLSGAWSFVLAAGAKAHVSKAFTGMRRQIQRMPSRYVPEMAAKLGCEPALLDAELTRTISETMTEMSAPEGR